MPEFKRCDSAGLSIRKQQYDKELNKWTEPFVYASEVEALLERQAKEMAILQRTSDRKTKLLCDWKREQRDRAAQEVADTVKGYCETERTVPIKPKEPSVDVFKAEDFDGRFVGAMRGDVASFCNWMLSQRGQRVYGTKAECGNYWVASETQDSDDTHTALLIAVEPIVRDTAESLLRSFVDTIGRRESLGYPQSDVIVSELIERARAVLK